MNTLNNNDTSSSSYEYTSLRYWCFMCEKEFPHLYTGPADVFCPTCNGIAEQIEDEDDPRNFKMYDAQREAPNANLQNNQANPNISQGPQASQGNNQGGFTQQQSQNGFNAPRIQTQIVIQSFGPQGMMNMQTFGGNNLSGQGVQFQQQNIPNMSMPMNNPFNLVSSMLSGVFGNQNMGFGNIFEQFDNAIIEQFLRNDPNRYGAPPAEQDSINKLKESSYCPETCKTKECSICQEDYKQGEILLDLPCDHNFHKNCVTQWLTQHNSCPVCRKPLEAQNISNN